MNPAWRVGSETVERVAIRVTTLGTTQVPNQRTYFVIMSIVSAIVIGLIVGVLARLVMPGKQNIGVIVTVALGALGAFLGSWVSYKLGYSNQNGGFEFIPVLVGVVIAVILIAGYLGITGKRASQRTGR